MRLPNTPGGLAQIGGLDLIVCSRCGNGFDGNRHAARRARWEPNSFDSQHAVDHGPMTCPDCMKALLDDVLDAMATAAKAGRLWTLDQDEEQEETENER